MNILIIFWILVTCSFSLIPWTVSGVRDFFATIPKDREKWVPRKNKKNFYLALIQDQILPLIFVITGCLLLGIDSSVGILPKFGFFKYTLAALSGLMSLLFSTLMMILLQKILVIFCSRIIENDLLKYEYNVTVRLSGMSKLEKILKSVFNGFGEEALMRILIIGVLALYTNISPYVLGVVSLLLNGIHHSYQGRVFGTLGAIVAHSPYVIMYLVIDDFFFIGIAHVVNDLVALLLLPYILRPKN
jgi:hypothetical protein